MTPPSARVRRHFPDAPPDLDDPAARALAIGQLLEDGDRDDLAWLAGRIGRDPIAAWFDRHAVRRLSRRSRAFWAAALDRPLPAPDALAEALWPLA